MISIKVGSIYELSFNFSVMSVSKIISISDGRDSVDFLSLSRASLRINRNSLADSIYEVDVIRDSLI